MSPSAGGLLHADANGPGTPNSSVTYLNYAGRLTVSGSAVVPVGADGAIRVRTSSRTDLIMDVQGYYSTSSPMRYVSQHVASRIVNTTTGLGSPKQAYASNTALKVPVTMGTGVPLDATAATVHLIVLNRSRTSGYLTIFPTGQTAPTTSVNFPASARTEITVTTGLATSRSHKAFTIVPHGATVDLAVDVDGYFARDSRGGLFHPDVERIYDSRTTRAPLAPSESRAIAATSTGRIPAASTGVNAVVGNVATIAPTSGAGNLRLWASGAPEPLATTTATYGAGVSAGFQAIGLGVDGGFRAHNLAATPVDLVVDVQGWYDAPTPAPTGTYTGLDMHDGTIVEDNGTFYMYGTQYECGFTWGRANTPFCGFAVRSAPTLAGPWSLPTLLFSPTATVKDPAWTLDNGKTWNTVCGARGAGCFNPRMLHRPDGAWVLWFNAPSDYNTYRQNAYWAMGCNGPMGPCGSSAGAPFGSDHKPTLVPCLNNGDFSIGTDGDKATIVCSLGSLSQEELTPSWTDGTGNGTKVIKLAGVTSAEGVGIFKRQDGTWQLTYSTPNCGYCSGPPMNLSAAGPTMVRTGYATAPEMLGPWTAQGTLSQDYCRGQPRTVFTADGRPFEWLDRWTGDRNETEASVQLEDLSVTPWTCATHAKLASTS
ncbi:hypothetical protein [Terrabacter sp. NPDC080008]|uniref:hypothetical protein n=1 Tax=Terrabacter sp. NPDC080008 TaxID=3155176 RepID=UPI00344F38B9